MTNRGENETLNQGNDDANLQSFQQKSTNYPKSSSAKR